MVESKGQGKVEERKRVKRIGDVGDDYILRNSNTTDQENS